MDYGKIIPYTPPEWCSHLKNCPTHKASLAMAPTPIHQWNVPDLPQSVQLYIKRDDMNGNSMGGNKLRRVEFVIANAIKKGCGSIITFGGDDSNECRTTALAAAHFGLKAHLLSKLCKTKEAIRKSANFFLAQTCGADVYLVPYSEKYEEEFRPRAIVLSDAILKQSGKPTYSWLTEGYREAELHGYLSLWEEMIQQGVANDFDDVVLPCATGKTCAALAIGNYLTGGKVRMHAVPTLSNASCVYEDINTLLQRFGMEDVQAEQIIDLLEGYVVDESVLFSPDDYNLCNKVAEKTGVCCTPMYTGRALKALIANLESNRARFKGDRILFIHTGGLLCMLHEDSKACMRESASARLFDWEDINIPPIELL